MNQNLNDKLNCNGGKTDYNFKKNTQKIKQIPKEKETRRLSLSGTVTDGPPILAFLRSRSSGKRTTGPCHRS